MDALNTRCPSAGSCTAILIIERLESDGRCLQGVVVFFVDFPEGQPPGTYAEEVGYDCCPGTKCPDRTPVGWLLVYSQLVAAKDLRGLSELIPPDGQLKVRNGYGYPDTVDGFETTGFSRQTLSHKLFNLLHVPDLIWGTVECPDEFGADGRAQCFVRYLSSEHLGLTWKRRGKSVYLIEIEEDPGSE